MAFKDTDATIGPAVGTFSFNRPHPAESPVPLHLWGGHATRSALLPGSTLQIDLSYCPEGMRLVSACPRCGARDESLLDVRGSVPPYVESSAPDALDAHMERVLRATPALFGAEARRLLGTVAPLHVDCSTDQVPSAPPMDPAFARTLDALVRRQRVAIARGRQLPPAQYVFYGDGVAMEIPILDAPPGLLEGHTGRARYEHIELQHWALRDFFRANAIRPMAIFSLSEAWMSSQAVPTPAPGEAIQLDPATVVASRTEVLVAMLTTPERTYSGYADIHRENGVVGEGPGTFGPLVWRPGSFSGSLSEGLLVHCATPLPPDVLARAKGEHHPPPTTPPTPPSQSPDA